MAGSRTTHHINTYNIPHVHRVSSCDKRRVTIDILPHDVLLHIFHCDRMIHLDEPKKGFGYSPSGWRWHRLVHVCRRWRSVVFASPNFLELRLLCTPWTRAELTGVWPPLPIIIMNLVSELTPEDYDYEAAIVHPDRVYEINFRVTSPQLQRLASAMQEPFPALTRLTLGSRLGSEAPAPALPEGFVGGSVPSLQYLSLYYIAYPALPKLLSSATDLTTLHLLSHPVYISPEAMVTSLSTLTRLERLSLKFRPPLSSPDWESQRPPPPTRTVLPALTWFKFEGISEYLEDLLALIDIPLLDYSCIVFDQLISDISQLALFMKRTKRFHALNEAHVTFDYDDLGVGSLLPIHMFDGKSGFKILCRGLDWRLSSLAQVFKAFFPSMYMVEHLYVYGPSVLPSRWQENLEWLKIYRPFTVVKNLYLSREFAPHVASAMQELVGGKVAEVLPTLQNIFLEGLQPSGPIQEDIQKFVAARQPSGNPITVSVWERPVWRRTR